MAMDLLFENQTQMDESVIHHLIEKNYKRPEKTKQYHIISLAISILATAATIYFAWIGIQNKQPLTLICTIAIAVAAVYAFLTFYNNTEKNQIKAAKKHYSQSLLIPRKIKIYKNVMFQSAGKSHGEYRLHQFTAIESWDHYFLLSYENSYVVIDKNGFTKGTAEEFETFMTQRIQKNC